MKVQDDFTSDTATNQNTQHQPVTVTQPPKHRQADADRVRDLICFSHLRWNFVFQRPQHLLTLFSSRLKVDYVEEPVFDAAGTHPRLAISQVSPTTPFQAIRS